MVSNCCDGVIRYADMEENKVLSQFCYEPKQLFVLSLHKKLNTDFQQNHFSLCMYSKISPGWQSNTLQIASRVEKRIARAFSVLRTERFAIVIPTFSASSVRDIFLFAIITSKLIRIIASSHR